MSNDDENDLSAIDLTSLESTSDNLEDNAEEQEQDDDDQLDVTFTALQQFKSNDLEEDAELKTTIETPNDTESDLSEELDSQESQENSDPFEDNDEITFNTEIKSTDLPATSDEASDEELQAPSLETSTQLENNEELSNESLLETNDSQEISEESEINLSQSNASVQLDAVPDLSIEQTSQSPEMSPEEEAIPEKQDLESSLPEDDSIPDQAEQPVSTSIEKLPGLEENEHDTQAEYTVSNIVDDKQAGNEVQDEIQSADTAIDSRSEEDFSDLEMNEPLKPENKELIFGIPIGESLFHANEKELTSEFNNINTFSTASTLDSSSTTPLNFSILIKDISNPLHINKILEFSNKSNIDIDKNEILEQSKSGQIKLRNLSEYSAMFILRNLRMIGANFLIGLDDEIEKIPQDSLASRKTSEENINNSEENEVRFKSLPDNHSDILLTTSSTVPGETIAQFKGVVSVSRVVPADTAPEIALDKISDSLLEIIKRKALYKQANAVIGANVSIQTTQDDKASEDPPKASYHVIAVGTAVRLVSHI